MNASVISGTIGDTSLSANIPRLNAAANFTHSLNLTTTQQNPMALTSSAPGGTWLNLANTSSAAATTWSFISTGTANGEGAGKLLFRDADANAVRMTMNGAGAVGIGTTNPEGGILDVEGSVRMNDNELYIRGGTDTGHGLGWYGLGKLYNGFNIDGPVLYGFNGGGLGVSSPDQLVLDWDYNGNVNVGNTSNRGTLNVHGDANIGTASQGASLAVRINDKSIRLTSDGGFPMLQTTSVTAGDVYAGYLRMRHVIEMWPKSDGSAGAKLDVRNSAGSPTITLDGQSGEATVKTLNITGGSDLAEPFPMEDEVEAGSVMIIDEDHPGWLKISSHAYDTRVAGIVSGANGVQPGVSLRQKGVLEEGRNVALTGRVYAFAEATDSPIKPGDLLTTSDRPGYLMKVTDHTRAQGAVIGKAMSRLASGTGMVLVLVNLQ